MIKLQKKNDNSCVLILTETNQKTNGPVNAHLRKTNGPVNAHLRSAVYTNVIENSPSIGAGEALGPLFFQNNQYTVHTSFFPSNDILTVYPFQYIGNPC